MINPTAGGIIGISGSISDSYGKPITWSIALPNGQTVTGTGATATATWDGKDASGKVVTEGNSYPITLTAQSSCGCSDSKTTTAHVEPPAPGQCGLYVQFGSSAHVASGNLAHNQELFSTKGGALPLAMTLYYNSLDPVNGALGWGWSHSYDKFLVQNSDGSVLLKEGNWQRRLYTLANGAYVSRPGDYSTLVKNGGGTFTLTQKDGTRYNFGANGKILEIVDRNGNAVSFAYTNGNLTTIMDPAGRTATLSYDGNSRIATISEPMGNTHSFTYSNSALVSVSTQNSELRTQNWSYTYDANAFMLAKTDPLGNTTTYGYDDNHRVVSSVDPQGNTRNVAYPQGSSTGSTTFTETDGGAWTYAYDTQAGTLTSKTDPQGGVTRYTYDASGNRTSATDPAGATTSYVYDGQGNMTASTDAAGQTTSYSYNSFGQVLSITDSQGNATGYGYDAKGNLTSMTDPAGATTQYEFDAKGNVTTVINPAGQATSFTYDESGNLASVTDPTGATTSNAYDANGNLLFQTDAAGKTTTYTYDSGNHLLTVTDPLGNVTAYGYDVSGNKTSQTDANGNTTYYEYDSKGHVVRTTDALGNVTTYTYGGAGCPSCGGGPDKLTALTDAKGQTTMFLHDSLGRLVQETDPLQKATAYAYDHQGNLTAKTDANGATVNYAYDALKRLASKSYPDETAVSYSYDPAGRISTAANSDVSYSYTYDNAGRVTSVTDSRGYVIAYEYDMTGNRTKMTFQPGTTGERVTSYVYDAGNRLTSITSPAGTFTYGYDALGRRTSLAYSNQVSAAYTYDDAGRLTGLAHTAGSSTIAAFTYTLDKVGNRTSKDATEAEQYLYDLLYRLLNVTSSKPETFSYDQVGNRQSGPGAKDTAYLYNTGNQVLQGRKLAYGYDNNGNLTTRAQAGVADRSWAHTWDYENRLAEMEKKKGSENRTVTFKFDPSGRRIEKKATISKGGIAKTETFTYVYDNDNIVLEILTTDTGTEKTFYTQGVGVDEHLALERNGQFYYYHADGLGSIVSITDANRNVVQSYEYDSFGMVKPSTSFRNSYMYTGREWDKETGLYFYRARYYDPMEGRFISRDPIGFKGGINLYSYTKQNPINYTDPSGLKTYMCKKFLHALGGSGQRSGPDIWGNPLYHQYICVITKTEGRFVVVKIDLVGHGVLERRVWMIVILPHFATKLIQMMSV